METGKEEREEGVKRRVVTAHLVGREMFRKVLHKQLLSSLPLAVKDTCPCPQLPRRGTGSASAEQAALEPASPAVLSKGKVCPTGRYPLVKLWMEKCSQLESCFE